jgi:N-acyl-D-amino-acid deacylase
MTYDLLIRGASVVDGTGQPAYPADVAILGSRIAAIGDLASSAGEIIDGAGLTLLPGLIDPHSHADLILPLPPAQQVNFLEGKLRQGITTLLIGNCGLGCAPLGPRQGRQGCQAPEPLLRALLGWMTPEETPWPWQTLGEYLAHLEENGTVVNVGMLVPHGAVRVAAMGVAEREPTRRELGEMRRMVEESLTDGALGLSSGLIYPPGLYSRPAELTALAKLVEQADGIYTSHLRGSSETLLPAVQELLDVGRASGVRIHHSHNEAVGRAHWSKIERVLRLEEQAEEEGVRISYDMFPYTAAATMMTAIYPPWALEGGFPAFRERLLDATLRRRMAVEIERFRPRWPPWGPGGWPHNLVRATGWEAIIIGSVTQPTHRKYVNRSLAELATITGKSPFNAISDLLLAEEGQVSMLLFEISGNDAQPEYLQQLATHRLACFCTDAEEMGRGVPHPAAYGALPRILSRFVGPAPLLSFEEAVHRMTLRPARLFGIRDRGVIRPGAFADLVLCRRQELRDQATWRSPRRLARGISHLLINGGVVWREVNQEKIESVRGQVIRRDRS